MGMLMHHTWLEQRKNADKDEKKEVSSEETKEPETEPVKKTGVRRKTSK